MKKTLCVLNLILSLSALAQINEIVLSGVSSRGTCIESIGGRYEFIKNEPFTEIPEVYVSDYFCQIDNLYRPQIYEKVVLVQINNDLHVKEYAFKKNTSENELLTFSNEVYPFSKDNKELIDQIADNSNEE